MRHTCSCGHDWVLHRNRHGYRCPCRRIGCGCTNYTPAPAGGLPPADTAPAGVPLYSEDRCERCGHITDCCGNCKCEGTQHD